MKHEDKMSFVDLSKFSKHLLFLSVHKHQKIQVGTIFKTAALALLPADHQLANNLETHLGITQDIPKLQKIALHKAEATSQ
jgi:hypothetical protein